MPNAKLFARCLGSAFVSLAFALAGCGGGSGESGGSDSDSAAPAPAAVVSGAPAASFTATGLANAHSAVVFDAGASASADGSALQYAWAFGDGQHGGGKSIAHVFANAGTMTVTLTVVDAAARRATATRTVTVAAAAAPAGSVTVHALVRDLDGVALSGVKVAAAGSASGSASTDATGRADVVLGTATPLTLKLSKAGYADQFAAVQLPAGAGTDTLLEATLRPRDAALTLADAHAGGNVSGRDGAALVLPADALVNGAGTLVSGAVQVALTPVDVTLPGAGGFPGRFDGVRPDGTSTPIVSFGTTEFVLTSGSERLQLAPGKTATIDLPISAAQKLDGSVLAVGDTVPLWSLDEATSLWIQEGSGQVVASAASPSGLALRATVSHFSWWNADIGFDPYGPKPRCVYDTDSGNPGGNDTFATATVCNLLAEIDRGLGGSLAASRAQALALRQATLPLPPRIAGYSRQVVLPIAGGTTIPVPANVGIALRATALNGTWTGRTVVNGPVGVQEEVLVKMRPLTAAGPLAETIALPFDAERSLLTGTTARFTFASAESQFARITAVPVNGSTLVGQVRLLQGTTLLATAAFGPASGTLVAALPAAGSYGVEVVGLANTPGAYRLQVELLGGVQGESLPFAFDATRSLPAFTRYRATFDVAAAGAGHFAFQPMSSVPMQLRLRAPDGSVLYAATTLPGARTPMIDMPLAVAGRYTYEVVADAGQAIDFRFTGEPTSWLAIAPGLDTSSSFLMVGLVADRDGKPVVGFLRNPTVDLGTAQTLLLRRWTGSAWEAVGSDATIPVQCTSGNSRVAKFAFDSSNAPIVVYGNGTTDGSTSSTHVLRYAAGAWQGVGPNDGVLPNVGDYNSSCFATPALVVDSADRPIVAYQASGKVFVQRLESNAWATLGAFDTVYSSFDLKIDAGDAPWFVHANTGSSGSGGTIVRRFDGSARAFVSVGPNGGRLPETTTSGLTAPRLLFGADGKPVIAAFAAVGTGGVTYPGLAVYRYDGAIWSTAGAYQAGPGSYPVNNTELGFTIAGNEALLAWSNVSESAAALVVQRNTASGYAPVGAGLGELVQYMAHGITPGASALDPRLLATGGEVYLAVIVRPDPDATSPSYKVMLLKKVGG